MTGLVHCEDLSSTPSKLGAVVELWIEERWFTLCLPMWKQGDKLEGCTTPGRR